MGSNSRDLPMVLRKRDSHGVCQLNVRSGDASKSAYDPTLAHSLATARVAHQAVEAFIEKKRRDEADELIADPEAEEQQPKNQNDPVLLIPHETKPKHNPASGITIRPKGPSLGQRLSHLLAKARMAPVPQGGDPPRYWDCLDCAAQWSRAPAVGDVFYALPKAFDAPFEGEELYENAGLVEEARAARAIKGFYVTAEVDVNAVAGHNKLVKLTLTAKRKGGEVWAFHGIERRDLKASVVNSSVPARLRPHNAKLMPEGLVDVVITADKGFYLRAQKKGQQVQLEVVVPADTPIPRATSWNQERSDYKEPLLQALVANAIGFHSRSLRMRMVNEPGTPIAFGIRCLDWMQNTKLEHLAKVQRPLNVVGGRPSVLNGVEGLYKDWKPPAGRLSEFMYR